MLKHQTLSLDVRSVDDGERVISGYANAFGVVDSYGTRWTRQTFERTLREDADRVRVFVGHDMTGLPVGKPLTLRIDDHGLFTETLIAPGPQGDDILAKARFFQEQGSPLGMSVGFKPRKSHMDGAVEVFDDVDLREYSFVSFEAVPGSQVVGVRAEGQPDDPPSLINDAIETLMEARSEIEQRTAAARTLGDDVFARALTPELRATLATVRDRIVAILGPEPDPTPTQDSLDEARNDLEAFLDRINIQQHKETTHA